MFSGDDFNLSEWMTNLPLAVKQKPITKVAIPGSHDSFAYPTSLTTALPISNDSSPAIRKAGTFPGVRTFIKRWAVTQSLDITSQLGAGIRYLDLRVSNPPQEDDPDCSFRCVHALYGAPLLEVVENVVQFLKLHPKEIILIDINHLYGFNEDAVFTDMMQSVLCLLSPSQLAPPPSRSRPISEYTIEKLQEAGQNIILIGPDLGDSAPFTDILWKPEDIRSPWPDSDKIPYILKILTRLSEQWRLNDNPSCMMVYQGVATVKGRDIAFHPFSSLEKYVAAAMTKATFEWLADRSALDGINIVISDFVTKQFSQIVTAINYKNKT